jgi:hypothetical protein
MPAMDSIAIIHNAARHYCINGIAKWRERFSVLCSTGRNKVTNSDGSWAYTDEAYGIFPRYEILKAILAEIESFSPTDFKSAGETTTLLSAAADTAESDFTSFKETLAIAAANEERRNFQKYVNSLELDKCANLPLLPFRRSLTTQQHKQLHAALISIWGTWYGGCTDLKSAPNNITLHTEAMETPDSYSQLRKALIEHGITRLFEIREWGSGYELDVELAGFTYTGAEGFWTSGDLSWMVYSSHESSITFGGTWLIEHMRRVLTGFDRYIYKGWDISAYGA